MTEEKNKELTEREPKKNNISTTKKLAGTGVFAALACVVSLL